ncbi:FAD:protein FMN transferase [Lentilactobacillus sp. SPB1-3]|uniref:FAD:protein FMN transferase n=1 Tax=Lentilactobacillus terminaliae TaxID=3003483 RepID=A0ACD5DG26_9LACO|nr:FAD:protein FMN transferase [Lentilactobacillus sp. SPB1-3]MCZ0976433.1 FAD:protein FMN transferase [Lentilactobacillus sp. SPB1-3]
MKEVRIIIQKIYSGLGTKITLSIDEQSDPEILPQTNELIQKYEDILTVNREQSEIMDINHNAGIKPIQISTEAYDIVKQAVIVSNWHAGFNVAIGPLVKLWKIGFDGANVPSKPQINNALHLTNSDNIILDDVKQTVFLTNPDMELDLGGIAKGYIADKIKEFWLSKGVTNGIINLGGNILLVGRSNHENGMWNIGIQNPELSRGNDLAVVTIPESSIVTSGVYERFLKTNHHMYHHIIDSLTGYPFETNITGITAITPTSTEAEIWTSIGFFNGIDRASKMASELGYQVSFIVIYSDHTIEVSDDIKDKFILTDSDYQIL